MTDGGDTQPLSHTLKDFTSLQHVFLSASVLYNHGGRASYTNYDSMLLTKLLPPSITSLSLAGNLGGQLTPRLGHALVYLAKQCGGGPRKEFKALGRVRCEAGILEEMGVKEAFEARGVDFAFESWPLSEPTHRGGEETPLLLAPLVMKDSNVPLPDDDDEDL